MWYKSLRFSILGVCYFLFGRDPFFNRDLSQGDLSPYATNSWCATLGLFPFHTSNACLPRLHANICWTWPVKCWPKVQWGFISRKRVMATVSPGGSRASAWGKAVSEMRASRGQYPSL